MTKHDTGGRAADNRRNVMQEQDCRYISTLSSGYLQVIFPKELTADEIEYIRDYLRIIDKQLARRMGIRTIEAPPARIEIDD